MLDRWILTSCVYAGANFEEGIDMFNFSPQFGRFIKSKSEWASVPLAFVPFGYKIERSIINGRRYYRVSGPQLSMTSARSIEHARWLIAEAIRTSRITQSDTTLNDGTFLGTS